MENMKSTFKLKLAALTEKSDVIRNISEWVLLHESLYKDIVLLWNEQLYNANTRALINYIWLCHDIILRSQKQNKGTNLIDEFQTYLPSVVAYMYHSSSPEDLLRLERVVGIWSVENIYTKEFLVGLRQAMSPSVSLETPPIAVEVKVEGDILARHFKELQVLEQKDSSHVIRGPIARILAGQATNAASYHNRAVIERAEQVLREQLQEHEHVVRMRLELLSLLQMLLTKEAKHLEDVSMRKLGLETQRTKLQRVQDISKTKPG